MEERQIKRLVRPSVRLHLDTRAKRDLKAAKVEVTFEGKTQRYHTGHYFTVEE